MTPSGPPEKSAPDQGRGEATPVAWGNSLALKVVGRDDELAHIVEMLGAVRSGGSRSLVITGEPGIGKSTLLLAAEHLTPDFHCMRVRGVESEQPMAYAGLHQALVPLRERLSELPEVQAQAVGQALGWASGPSEPNRFLVAAATMSVIAAEARGRPVLVVIDDVQWVDHESAGALAFAARRLEEDPVCFLWSARERSAPGDLLRGVPELPRVRAASCCGSGRRRSGGVVRSPPHHASSKGGGGHHLIAGLEKDLHQSDGRLVPNHGPPWRRLDRVALQDVGADLPAVLNGGGGELVGQP